ncbi:MAG: GAF domain-containing protein [Anaerolineales bacterium]|nr:GAF domain-containing protein [Anaerolineales bacterium]
MDHLKHASPERHVTLLTNASRVAKAVTSILDPDELLRWSVDIICDEFGFYYAGVFLINETGQWAILRAGRGEIGESMVQSGYKLAVGGHSMIGMATRLRQPRIARNITEEVEFTSNPYLPSTHSEIALPLAIGETVIGALTVQSTDYDAFTEEDVSTLQGMADILAIAIANSQLHRQNQELLQRTERRAHLLTAANQVGKSVTSILDLDQLLSQTVDIICDTYGFYYAGIFLIDASGQWAVLRAGHGEAGQSMLAEGHKLAVGGHSMIGLATGLREARIALDVGEERVHFKNPYLPYTRSEMALPLMLGAEVLGAVTVQSIEERAFSEDDILTLQTMADHLAIAINNARLLRELEHANLELLRTKTYEALATATTQAVHWIGNKALPITTTVARIKEDLSNDPIDLASIREDLDLIDESARLIVEVKENLLGPAREQKPRPAMLEDVVQAAAYHSGLPAAQLQIVTLPGTPMVLADTTQLARALGNLFRNAMEASANHIHVRIAPATEGDLITLEIADNGEGIPPEMMDKIWAAFITTKGAGHPGLGLPACLHVISQLDGRVSVNSQPGEGTIFNILLPVHPQQELESGAKEPTSARPVARTMQPRVLLIDDNDPWAQFTMQVLTDAGYQVNRLTSLERKPKADVVLVDEALTEGSLPDVLDQLKATNLAGKTIIVCAAPNVERTAEYLKAGIKDIVLKPYTLEEFAAILAS